MKRIVALALCACALLALAKDKAPLNLPYSAEGRVQYREVIEVPGVPSAELMKRARLWLASAYRSAPDVTKGSEADQLVVKGIYDLGEGEHYRGTWRAKHTMVIEAKEGRVRVTIDRFEVARADGIDHALSLESYENAPNDPRSGFGFLFKLLDKEVRDALASL
jgi:hypothetical protein